MVSKKKQDKTPQHKHAVVTGRIEGHPDGHGFLVPDGPDAPWIALPAVEMRQVLRGDRSTVRLVKTDPRGRAVGEIIEVLERANRRIVGRLREVRGAPRGQVGVLFLVPEDRRMPVDILIPADQAGRAKPGEVATVELVVQPSKHAQPIGRVLEVLGNYT